MAKFLKELMVNELKGLASQADSCILADLRGLTAKEADELRRLLREKGIRINVVPNRLYRRALAEALGEEIGQSPALNELLRGPTAVVFGGDGAVTAAKVLVDWAKENKKLKIKGGILDRRPIDPKDVEELSKLPSKEVLLGNLAAALVQPIQALIWFLEGTVRNIACALEAISKKEAGSDSDKAA